MITDFVGHFSWGEFALIALLYSLVPFLSSARYSNVRAIRELIHAVQTSPITAIKIHLASLALLLAIFWIPAHYYSNLPDWLKLEGGSGFTMLDGIIYVLVILMAVMEEKLIKSHALAI